MASAENVRADTPEDGHGETTDNPIAAPKVRNTNDKAAAVRAPANTAPHSTKLVSAAAPGRAAATDADPTCTMMRPLRLLASAGQCDDREVRYIALGGAKEADFSILNHTSYR